MCKFVVANSFWKHKTTIWQAFEILRVQQFLEVQNNNVTGVRTFWGPAVFGSAKQQCGRRSNFVSASSCWKRKTTMWKGFEILLGIRSFWKCKTTIWQAFEFWEDQRFL